MIREMDVGGEVQLRVAALNTCLRGSLIWMLKVAMEMDISQTVEAWVRPLDLYIMSNMSESENTILERDGQKRFGG